METSRITVESVRKIFWVVGGIEPAHVGLLWERGLLASVFPLCYGRVTLLMGSLLSVWLMKLNASFEALISEVFSA